MKKVFLISLGLFLIFASCKNESQNTSIAEVETKKVPVPAFNPDGAYEKIEKQLAFGYRVPGTKAHKNTQEWIATTMESYGATITKQDFEASFLGKKNVACTNIMAQINPEFSKRILLAAHYDSRMVAEKDDERKDEPIPGADDGASGVAVLMQIAEALKEHPIDMGVDFLFFDAEDQGGSNVGEELTWALGSQHWSKNIAPKGYRASYGILLDMVGSEKATFGKEDYSKYYAGLLVDKVWTLAQNMGYSDFFQDFSAGRVTDDHKYVNEFAKIPMIDIINMSPDDRMSFGKYHHTHDDNINVISKRTLRVVGQVVLAVLYNENNGDF